jgi:hypothetical protein
MTECVGGEDPAQLDSGTSGPSEDRTRLALWISLALSVAWNCPGPWLPPIPWFWPSKQSSLRILWNLVTVNTGLAIAEGVDIYFACWDTEVCGV